MKNTKIRTLKICLFVTLISATNVWAQPKIGFEVSGHLNGLKDGEIVKLGNRFKDWHYETWIDSCKVINGNFHLRTSKMIPEAPRYYEIFFNNGKHRKGTSDGNIGGIEISLFVGNGQHIEISGGDINTMRGYDFSEEIKVSGSPSSTSSFWADSIARIKNEQFVLFYSRLQKIQDSIGYSANVVKQQIDFKEKLDKEIEAATRKADETDRIGIPLLITKLYDNGNYHGFYIKNLYEQLPDHIRDSYYGQQMKRLLPISVGQTLPDFTFFTPDSSAISLKNEVTKSRITIVHLWGPGSYDQGHYQQELKAYYSQFHEKGLGVIAVSADTSADDWKIRVQIKKYPWVNVLAKPKGWSKGSFIQDVYQEGGHNIPNTTNILLDQQGRIIAWDPQGPELRFYLEKYFGD